MDLSETRIQVSGLNVDFVKLELIDLAWSMLKCALRQIV
jgi:hypothetical protein